MPRTDSITQASEPPFQPPATDRWRKAYHEAGHAVVAYHARGLSYRTSIEREVHHFGVAGGVNQAAFVQSVSLRDNFVWSHAGVAAVGLVFGWADAATGAELDHAAMRAAYAREHGSFEGFELLFAETMGEAIDSLRGKRAFVDWVARELHDKGTLGWQDIDRLYGWATGDYGDLSSPKRRRRAPTREA
jgi:hypothetical protein